MDTLAPPRRTRRQPGRGPRVVDVDVVVVGAGQGGLSAAHHLRRARLTAVGAPGWERAAATFVVLDDGPAAGGAWQRRWSGLPLAAAHRAQGLPGMPLVAADPGTPARDAVPAYFAQYEDAFALHVQRPVRVDALAADGDRLAVSSHYVALPDERVVWRARGVVNASGSWSRPFWPACPGRERFAGSQLHVHDYRGPGELAAPVVVVGAGADALHLLAGLDGVATTWVSRRLPHPDEADLTSAVRDLLASPAGRVRPMFERIGPRGVWFAPGPVEDGFVDGPPFVAATTIVWATGFRPALDHLAPLRPRGRRAGARLEGTQVVGEPRLHVVGSAAGLSGDVHAPREAVRRLRALLGL